MLIILTFQNGCVKKETEVEYLEIEIDWSTIKKNPDYPLTACGFHIFSGVKLTEGPFKEVINGEVYYGMKGYENNDIKNHGNRVFRFLINREKEKEGFSVILESMVKTRILFKNFPGIVQGIDSNKVNENVFEFDSGKYEFQMKTRDSHLLIDNKNK